MAKSDGISLDFLLCFICSTLCIFINNYILDECTHHCITYSVTAHPDDGQARLKHVGATN
jgi:hypothetical protein